MMMKASKFLGVWGAAFGSLLVGLFLTGCHSGGPDPRFSEVPGVTGSESQTAAAHPAAAPATAVQPASAAQLPANRPATTALTAEGDANEVLQPNDPIKVNFSDLPTPQPPFEDRIKADGTITLIQNETFLAAGKTRRQLEEEIRARYVPRKYMVMTVSVIRQVATQFYYVYGDVKVPGRQLYIERGLTVLKAISSCGDFTEFAKKTKVTLTREDGRKFTINCKKAIKDPKLDLPVYPGDKIFVPRKWI
jgi:protein involved in polysaccharide export with SLBB domain